MNASPLLSRRQTMAVLGASLISIGLLPQDAAATPDSMRRQLDELLKGATAKPGRIRLTAPEIAENGNTVPVTVSVDSPMTDADHVTDIHVLAERNPQPGVLSAALTAMSGKAEVSFRMRLSESQTIVVVAQMSDGTVWTTSRQVIVTLGGCGS